MLVESKVSMKQTLFNSTSNAQKEQWIGSVKKQQINAVVDLCEKKGLISQDVIIDADSKDGAPIQIKLSAIIVTEEHFNACMKILEPLQKTACRGDILTKFRNAMLNK